MYPFGAEYRLFSTLQQRLFDAASREITLDTNEEELRFRFLTILSIEKVPLLPQVVQTNVRKSLPPSDRGYVSTFFGQSVFNKFRELSVVRPEICG